MFEFSCLLRHFQTQLHLFFIILFFVAWTKMHEKPVQLFLLIIPNKLDGCKGNTAKA